MWKDISFLPQDENISSEDLLQFQVSLNRKLNHALSYIRNDQIINIEANKITVVNAKIQSAQIDTITANQINTGTLTGITITGNTINGGTINGSTINGSTINGGTINVETNVVIGGKLKLNNIADSTVAEIGTLIFDPSGFNYEIFYIAKEIDSDYLTTNIPRFGVFADIMTVFGDLNVVGNLLGVSIATSGSHTHTGETGIDGSHNHGVPNGTRLAIVDALNNIIGNVVFSNDGFHLHQLYVDSNGSHTHTIS